MFIYTLKQFLGSSEVSGYYRNIAAVKLQWKIKDAGNMSTAYPPKATVR